MRSFLTKFAALVSGVLSGFDRLALVGRLRGISYRRGLQNYLWANRVLFKDFTDHSAQVSAQLEEASLRLAREKGREIRYLNSARERKEDIARAIAARDHIKSGLICVLRSVDPCMSFHVRRNVNTRQLEVGYRPRKCMHLYHYQIHPIFGFMHARIQTWFPFRIHVCLNGREWLARQLDHARLKYVRRKNTFTWLEDVAQAQALFNQQLQAAWPTLLDEIAATLNPAHADIFAKYPCHYYWCVDESEWASDIMFRSRTALERVYPRLLRHAVTSFSALDVLRFLAQPLDASGKVPHARRHEVNTNLKERLEGARLKHWLDGNSIKMYDKSSVLRCETMIQDPEVFKVLRTAQGEPDGPVDWRPLRKGVVDLPRRGEVSQAANERYLEALAAVHEQTAVRDYVAPLCRPTTSVPTAATPTAATPTAATPTAATPTAATPTAATPTVATPTVATPTVATPTVATPSVATPSVATPSVATPSVATPSVATPSVATPSVATPSAATSTGRRARALNPFADNDALLLAAAARHEFCINGLRNRDIRRLLYPVPTEQLQEQRRRSAAVTRKLRLLCAHGLIERVPKTHRYLVTPIGRQKITAVLALRNTSIDDLIKTAA
jgi:hypothetical protein